MRKYIFGILVLLAAVSSCKKQEMEADALPEAVSFDISNRPVAPLSTSVSISSDATKLGVNYVAGTGMKLSWDATETLSVFIQNAAGTAVRYAGEVSSTGTAGDTGSRIFSGDVTSKETGEKYIYVWPSSLNSTSSERTGDADLPDGAATCYSLAWDDQSGPLGSLAGVASHVPVVWKEGGDGTVQAAQHQAYILRVCLQFNEDPGTISSVNVHTMDRSSVDKVFPLSFAAANLFKAQNNTLASAKTEGTALTEGFASSLAYSVIPAASATQNGGLWEAEVYLAVGSVKNLEVFNSKYRVEAVTASKTYRSAFISFPHQGDSAPQSAKSLDMTESMADGAVYKMTRKLSPCIVPTLINDEYKVNSLVGMWDQFGKLYDNDHQIKGIDASMPVNLQNLLGTTEKQTTFKTRYTKALLSNSPTFTWDLYESQCVSDSDHSQSNVIVNNIQITAPTKVYVTFISEYAWSQNLLGYYHYPTDHEPAGQLDVAKTFIFPNVSKPEHEPFAKGVDGHLDANNIAEPGKAPLQEYQTVQLIYTADGFSSEIFPAGTTIGFMMIKDPKATSYDSAGHMGTYNPHSGGTVLDWNAWKFFTNTSWNTDNSGYGTPARYNNFASGDICNTTESVYTDGSGRIPGLAIYGGRDDTGNNYSFAYSAMLFMVSTSEASAMKTFNKAALNVGSSGNLVVGKAGRKITYDLGDGVLSTNKVSVVDAGHDYTTTLSVAHSDLGPLKNVQILVGDVDKTDDESIYNNGVVTIASSVSGDVVIKAQTSKIAKVKSLAFTELSSLVSDDRIVLHANNDSHKEALGFKGGDFNFIKLPVSRSPIWNNGNALAETDITSTYVDIADFVWMLEDKTAASVAGFKLKNPEGKYLKRSATTFTGTAWPLVSAASAASVLEFENLNGSDVFIKVKEDAVTDYKYLTSRASGNSEVSAPIFFGISGTGHVASYGKWRIFKVWFVDR